MFDEVNNELLVCIDNINKLNKLQRMSDENLVKINEIKAEIKNLSEELDILQNKVNNINKKKIFKWIYSLTPKYKKMLKKINNLTKLDSDLKANLSKLEHQNNDFKKKIEPIFYSYKKYKNLYNKKYNMILNANNNESNLLKGYKFNLHKLTENNDILIQKISDIKKVLIITKNINTELLYLLSLFKNKNNLNNYNIVQAQKKFSINKLESLWNEFLKFKDSITFININDLKSFTYISSINDVNLGIKKFLDVENITKNKLDEYNKTLKSNYTQINEYENKIHKLILNIK